MAEQVEITNVGGDGDVASEATMQELVNAVKKMASQTGNDPRSAEKKLIEVTNKARKSQVEVIEQLDDKLEDFGEKVDDVNSRIGRMASGISGLVLNGIGALLTTTFDFGQELLSGGDKLSDFTQHVPIVGSFLTMLTSVIDNQVDSFRTLTGVGVDFGESIFEVRNQARIAGISLDAFQNAVANNSESLALFAGGATKGARAFARLSGQVQQQFGPQFARLGMTMEETAEFTADYLAFQTRLGRSQRINEANMSMMTGEYIMQLDRLAKVTGQQREQVAAQLQQESMDARMRAILSTLDEGAQLQLTGVTTMLESASPQAAEAVRELVAMNGVPVSDFAKDLVRLNPRLQEMSRGLRNGTVSQEEFMAEIRRTSQMAGNLSDEQMKQYATLAGLGSSVGSAAIEFLALGQAGEGLTDAQIQQAAAAADGAREILQFEQKIAQARNVIFGALVKSGVFDKLQEAASGVVTFFTSPQGMGLMKNAIDDISGFINGIITDLKDLGLKETLKKYVVDAFEALKSFFFGGTRDIEAERSELQSKQQSLENERTSLINNQSAGGDNALPADEYRDRLNTIQAAMEQLAAEEEKLNDASSETTGVFSGLLDNLFDMETILAAGGVLLVGLGALAVAVNLVGVKGALIAAALGFAGNGIGAILEGLSPLIESTGTAFKSMMEGISTVLEKLGPLVESVGTGFESMFNGMSTVIDSVGGAITSTITSVSEGIQGIVDSISKYKTAGIDATTGQIERLSAIPSANITAAAAGITAMKEALDGFNPGTLSTLTSWATGGADNAQMDSTTNQIAELASTLSSIDGAAVQAGASGVQAMGDALVKFSAGLAAEAGAGILDSISGWFGGGDDDIIQKVINMATMFAGINSNGVIAGSTAITDMGIALSSLASAEISSISFSRNLMSNLQALNGMTEFKTAADGLQAIADVQGLQTQFDIINLGLDADAVNVYNTAIEALVETMKDLNEELSKDNKFGFGDGVNAGDVISNIQVSSSGSNQGIGSLNSTMRQVLTVLEEQLEIQERTQRNTRGIGSNTVGTGVTAR